MRRCVFDGHPEFFDFSGFMWLLVEYELLQGIDIQECYYGRHIQCLIRSQPKDLFVDDGGEEFVDGGEEFVDDGGCSGRPVDVAAQSAPEEEFVDDGGSVGWPSVAVDDVGGYSVDVAAQSAPGESQGSWYGPFGLTFK